MFAKFRPVLAVCFFAFATLGLSAVSVAQVQSSNSQNSGSEAPSAESARQALIDLLEDPRGRQVLIEQLEALDLPEGGGTGPQTAAEARSQRSDAADTGSAADLSQESETQTAAPFAVRLGEYTQVIMDDFVAVWDRVGRSLSGISLLADGTITIDRDRITTAMLQVGLVLIAAMVLFKLGQWILVTVYRKFDMTARYGGWLTRALMLVVTTAADAATVAIGWGGGYAVALLSFGGLESGVTLLESLALNAFLITGLLKVGLRFVFAPERPELRLLPFDDPSAVYWCARLGFVVSWLGYGIMLAVPVANLSISFVIGNTVRFLVTVFAALYVLTLVFRNQQKVKAGIRAYSEGLSSEITKRTVYRLAGFWSLVTYVYILTVLIVWLFRPFDAVAIIMRSTGLSILTIMGGMLLSLTMTRAITGGIRLPENIRESLPALQGRLNAFVPRILKIFRFAVFVITLLILLDIWGVVSFLSWVQSEGGADLIGRYSSAFLVLLVAFAIWLAVMAWVDLRLRSRSGYVVTARERTLFQLFRNAFTVVVMVMAALLSLSELGIDIGPLIAGAGVVGLAISFGAQTLVKDIITGAFIQIENAINEGDVVTVGGTTGTVERLTVRSVRLRDLDGTTHIVPFSSVDMVSNFMRDFSYHVAVIGVAYDTDIRKAKAALEEAFRRLKNSDFARSIIGDLEMHGVTNFGASAIDIRARIKTLPGDQWGVGRAYNEFVKDVFDEQDIEIPFPQVTYHAATPPAAADLIAQKKKRSKADPSSVKPEDDAPPDPDH
ncbi:small conductance mechanosensitive channel [Roseibium hamelinense]|uniref:Small conductance mechanosensitive channel n=1 Tax=Roseibium hamelinense TaxID=150831 RepID=A0A562SNE3_9HYPH|nr:mechanosensitive ion channel domain-containing protein [Roseibium hamelinense]MTI44925.1 mechanosensitive ion channel [Roseibium hamelinense]TWI82186.1 small conductance mechanosensitive channel [Roseibium hamelinense]